MRMTVLIGALLLGTACSAEISGPEKAGSQATVEETAEPADVPMPRMLAIHSKYCSVCEQMKGTVEKIANQCDSKGVRVETVDVSASDNERLIDEYRIAALPTYLFLDQQGIEVKRLVGAQTETTIKHALGALRGRDCPNTGPRKAGLEKQKENVSCRSTSLNVSIATNISRS